MPSFYGRWPLAVGLIAAAIVAFAASDEASEKALDTPVVGSFSKETPGSQAVRIVSWNIDRGYGFDKVIDTLRSNTMDICLFQEVDLHNRRTKNRDVARGIAQTLGYNFAFGAEFQELSQGVDQQPAFTGQATLSRWPIQKTRIIRFARQSSWWKPHSAIPNIPFFQRRLGGRIALVTELAIEGATVVVYNLHLESRSGGAIQKAQLDEVLADLSRYPAGTPAIIGGDLNSKYNPSTVRRYLEKQEFHSVLGEKLARTHVIIGYLDWIFYRGPWQTGSGTVLRGTHASDHDPIVAELVARQPAANPSHADPARAQK